MNKAKFLKVAIVAGIIAAFGCGLVACSNNTTPSGGTAATVNGVDIMEDDVTQQIHTMRVQNNLTSDDDWGYYLVMVGNTADGMRTSTIESFRDRELKKEGAAELGIQLNTEEVNSQLESIKSNYGSDEKWSEALSNAGWTADQYQAFLEEQVLTSQLNDHFAEGAEITEETLIETANTYVPYYYDGKKRSSHILFKVEDTSDEAAMEDARARARDVLDQINSGSLSFADAARQYSEDASAEQGGDVGWNTTSFVTAYNDALNNLAVGEVSDLVESEYGIHIITVTDEYKAPEEITSMDQVPADFRSGIESAAGSVASQKAYTEWLDGLKEAADFKQNDMPSGLPYDIKLDKYQKAYDEMQAENSAEASGTSTDETSTEEGAGSGEASETTGEAESTEGAENAEASAGSASAGSAEASASAESSSTAAPEASE